VTTAGTSVDPVLPINRHASLANALFGDNHAESLTASQIGVLDAGSPCNAASLLN
jgi:prepilin-type processing-associated H-X9-DG protein